MRHRLARLVVELTHGGVVGLADLGVHPSAERLEDLVVVIMGSQPGEQVEACGGEDVLKALQAGVSLAVFDVADGAARRAGTLGQLELREPLR